MNRRTRIVVAAVVVAAVAGFAAIAMPTMQHGPILPTGGATAAPTTSSVPPTPNPAPSPTASAASPVLEYAAAAEAAAALPVVDPADPVPEYHRDEFGDGWIDVDGNGCAQRQDVLARDFTEFVLDDDGCTVLSGVLDDPYTATTIAFAHDRLGGDSQAVQVDHIVSLSAAWAGGAWRWSGAERVEFANDLDHLVAVDGPTNAAKGDRGPADWMPSNGAYACLYALDYASIVAAWSLSVSAADRGALVVTLTDCAA